MKTETINVVLKGRTPLLMHNIAGADLERKSRKAVLVSNPEEDVKKTLYMAEHNGKPELYVPANAIYAMLLRAASGYKVQKKSAVSLLAGTMRIEPEKIWLGTDKYEIDARSTVNPSTGGRIMTYRGKLPTWTLKFQIVYTPEYCDPELIKKVLEESGFKVGLLAYRPANKGWFGTFEVEKFEIGK